MMKYKDAVINHVKMWEWLAKTGKDKVDYFNEVAFEDKGLLKNDCYLCDFVFSNTLDFSCFHKCPVVWDTGKMCMSFTATPSLFDRWSVENDISDRKKLASKILKLKIKGYYKIFKGD